MHGRRHWRNQGEALSQQFVAVAAVGMVIYQRSDHNFVQASTLCKFDQPVAYRAWRPYEHAIAIKLDELALFRRIPIISRFGDAGKLSQSSLTQS